MEFYKNKYIVKAFLVLLLIADIVYSLFQHMHLPIDGDFACIILFEDGYSSVLHDPLGWTILTENAFYPGPNRFFAHFDMAVYFKTVPFIFQLVADAINSIYLSCGFAKTLIQVLITFVLAMYISGKRSLFNRELLLVAVLITPLFQASGYHQPMGVIDKSITYTFFYALPLGLLLIFFLPFYKEEYFGEKIKFSIFSKIAFVLFAIFLALNGPLIPGVVLVVCPVYLLCKWWTEYKKSAEPKFIKKAWGAIWKIPGTILFYFILFCFLSLYSLYLGTHNAENATVTLSLLERYARLPMGLFNLFSVKLGLPLLLFFILLNGYIINKTNNNPVGQKVLNLLKWIGIFSLIYILLLPLGGYREYRPNIIRRDTFMPVIIGMMYIYGLSTFFILKNNMLPYRKLYYIAVIVFLLIFTIADEPMIKDNQCEKEALRKLVVSDQKITLLENDCTVMGWTKFKDYNLTKNNSKILIYWGVLKEEKLYYQK
jgi:hypothetical protein